MNAKTTNRRARDPESTSVTPPAGGSDCGDDRKGDGVTQDKVNPKDVLRIVEKYQGKNGGLIAILEGIQAKYRYLPAEALRIVADGTKRSLAEVYGVATFYKIFSLKPRGKHFISVCLGTACHVRGAPTVAAEFERQLGIAGGETTPDREFTLETVNCLGGCALGPIAVVDGHYFLQVRQNQVEKILRQAKEGLERIEIGADARVFPISVRCSHCNHSLMDPTHPIDDHPSIRVTVSFGGEHGWLRMSSLYGSYNIECEHEIPSESVAHFFCPHCHAELIGSANCAECGAPTVPMSVGGGGMVQICSRRGCKSHILDLAGSSVQ